MWDYDVGIEILEEFVELQERGAPAAFRHSNQKKVEVKFPYYEGPRLIMLTKSVCEECGDEFPPTGRTKRFCSARCNLNNWRDRRRR